MVTVTQHTITLGMAMSAMAQNMSYGADNFYRSNNVTVQPISFPTLYQTTVAGNLFYLKHKNNNTAPAVVVGHPMGAVKEQSANLYATKLAEQGFITVSIDIPFWGGSDGEPRNAVLPDLYAEAFSAAVDYLGTQNLTSVDRERIVRSMFSAVMVSRGIVNLWYGRRRKLDKISIGQVWKPSPTSTSAA